MVIGEALTKAQKGRGYRCRDRTVSKLTGTGSPEGYQLSVSFSTSLIMFLHNSLPVVAR